MASPDDWGDLGMVIPANPCSTDPAPVAGRRHSKDSIYCHGCSTVIPDNSGQGLKPSCPNCWAAVDVDRPKQPERKPFRPMPPQVPVAGRQGRTERFDVF